ncbi:MAG TPA: hypothetical protein VIS96_09695 [Terrimicrobiaceae bacterium]
MGNTPQYPSSPTQNEPRAIRLTFSYVGSQIELTDTQRLAMFVPPSDSLEAARDQSGFWVEVRDADEQLLFRQVMHHPIETTREVFPADPHGEIIRTPVADPRGVFSIVIPDLTKARILALVGSPSEADRRSEAAREMARFDLTRITGGDYDK